MSRLALVFCFLLALVAGTLDWWPPMQNGPKAIYHEWTMRELAGKGQDALYLRPVATAVVSDRSGYHVAVGVPDVGELAEPAGLAGGSSDLVVDPTSEAVSGWATWVYPSLDGGTRADGGRYSRYDSHYIASNDYPLGTVLVVSDVFTGVVVDRGLMGPGRLDLSEAGFQMLESLAAGVIKVTVREAP